MGLTEEDGRYSFLSKPIRDLTKNWEVDIASHLEEYLEELEDVVFTFEGGRTMNFAEAALLIQGSTCVYSRKVEYLYILVYQVLDLLVDKKRKKQGQDKDQNGDGNDPDVTFSENDRTLMPLDDIQDVAPNLKENGKSVGTIQVRPMSMVPYGNEMGDDQLLSATGEVLGSRRDFRLSTSQVNHASCLLLEASAQNLAGLMSGTEHGDPLTLNNEDPTGPPPIDADVSDRMMDLDDDCNDPVDIPQADPEPEIIEEEGPLRSERIRNKAAEDKARLIALAQKPDPWALQDPFEPKKMTEKPFKKAKTFRLPDALNEKKTKKRKGSPETIEMPLVGEFISIAMFSYKPKIPKVLQGSCLPEFEKLCWSKLTERQSKQRVDIRAMETQLEQQILENEYNQDEGGLDIIADVNEDDVCAGFDDNDDDHEDIGPVLDWQDELFDVGPRQKVFEPLLSDEPGNSYATLVVNHIKAFYEVAERYAQTTDLSKRIAEWEAKIVPRLQEEEKYGPYDIHEYGTKVLSSMTKGNKIPLSRIMAGKPQNEIARLFLSSLMLANTGNLELTCPGILEEGMDKAEVTLLRTKLHSEELETYVAPSLQNKDKEN